MGRTGRMTVALIAPLLFAHPSAADDELDVQWSATLEGMVRILDDQEADDDVSGFFDQYEYTPNKSDEDPFLLGISEAYLDVFAAGASPRLQFRLDSPSSNLGVTGSDIDQPFLNQRAGLFGRLPGLGLDLDYRRFRSDELRFYSVTGTDLTSPTDRFFTRRTGMDGSFRLRLQDLLDDPPEGLLRLAPELSLRGGFQSREGDRQLAFMSNNFQQGILTQELDQSVSDIGGGLLFAPGGLLTVVFDFDHERFRENAPSIIESDLGAPFDVNSSSTIGFIPDTDRSTGSVRIHSRIGERATIQGGVQLSHLEQVETDTPWQQRDGLLDNDLLFFSANFAADVRITEDFSGNAFFKYDQRRNDIDRNTLPYDAPLRGAAGQCGGGGFPQNQYCQVAEFVHRLERISAGLEFVYQPASTTHFALGARGDFVDRDLDFVQSAPYRILRPNALVADESAMWTVYGRTRLRPLKGLGIRGEIGYRGAPKTGYIVDLDRYVYGKGRISYALPIAHPVLFTAFGRGSTGRNRDFDMVDGIGPVPTGDRTSRDFDRFGWMWGLTASTSLAQDFGLFASFFQSRDDQDYDLVTSQRIPFNINGQRYFQDAFNLDFVSNDSIDYHTDDLSLVVGTTWQATESLDLGLSYAFTRARTDYESNGATSAVIADVAKIDSKIHRVYFDVGYWLLDGLRLSAGYRYDRYHDRAFDGNAPTTSNVAPFDPSSDQHTVTVGVTITNELFSGAWGASGSNP